MKTFNYFKSMGAIYDRNGEYDGDEGYDFDFNVSDSDVLDEIVYLIDRDYFDGKSDVKKLRAFLSDFDLLDQVFEEYEEELKDIFEEDAMASEGD